VRVCVWNTPRRRQRTLGSWGDLRILTQEARDPRTSGPMGPRPLGLRDFATQTPGAEGHKDQGYEPKDPSI